LGVKGLIDCRYIKKCKRRPDPVSSKFQPDRHIGSITEKLDAIIHNYITK
jgi:hypothetical protein